jgi:hypothetical protein
VTEDIKISVISQTTLSVGTRLAVELALVQCRAHIPTEWPASVHSVGLPTLTLLRLGEQLILLLQTLIGNGVSKYRRLDWSTDTFNNAKISSFLLVPKLIKVIIVILVTGEEKICFV